MRRRMSAASRDCARRGGVNTYRRIAAPASATRVATLRSSMGTVIQATSSAYGIGRTGRRPRSRFQAKPAA